MAEVMAKEREAHEHVYTQLEGMDERLRQIRVFHEQQLAEMHRSHNQTLQNVIREAATMHQEMQHQMDRQFDAMRAQFKEQEIAIVMKIESGNNAAVFEAQINQYRAELHQEMAEDKRFHVEANKSLAESLEARSQQLATYIATTDKKLTGALSRMIDASEHIMKDTAEHQYKKAREMAEKHQSQGRQELLNVATVAETSLGDVETKMQRQLKHLDDKIAAASDSIDLVTSHLNLQNSSLEERIEKIMKTVVVV